MAVNPDLIPIQADLTKHGLLVAFTSSTPTHGEYHMVEVPNLAHRRRCLGLTKAHYLDRGLRFEDTPGPGEGGMDMRQRWR